MIGWDGPFFPTWPSKMDELISLRKIKYWNQLNIEVKTLEMKSGWLLKIKKKKALFHFNKESQKTNKKIITGTKTSSPGTTECRPAFHWNNTLMITEVSSDAYASHRILYRQISKQIFWFHVDVMKVFGLLQWGMFTACTVLLGAGKHEGASGLCTSSLQEPMGQSSS